MACWRLEDDLLEYEDWYGTGLVDRSCDSDYVERIDGDFKVANDIDRLLEA